MQGDGLNQLLNQVPNEEDALALAMGIQASLAAVPRSASLASSLSRSPVNSNYQLYQLKEKDNLLTMRIAEATRRGRVALVVQLTAEQTALRVAIRALEAAGAVPMDLSASVSASMSASPRTPVASPPRLSGDAQAVRDRIQMLKSKLVEQQTLRARIMLKLAQTRSPRQVAQGYQLMNIMDNQIQVLQSQIATIEALPAVQAQAALQEAELRADAAAGIASVANAPSGLNTLANAVAALRNRLPGK